MNHDAPSTEIPASQLGEVFARAKKENWTHLALVSPWLVDNYNWLIASGSGQSSLEEYPKKSIFVLDQPLKDVPKELLTLTNLVSLSLAGNEIGDHGARDLTSLKTLKSLDLNGNHIGSKGAQTLASLKSLTSLNLAINEIGDEGVGALGSLAELTALNLTNNPIGISGVRSLAPLHRLTSLSLSSKFPHEKAKSKNAGKEYAQIIGSLRSLKNLMLGGYDITDEVVVALASLKSLTSLTLHAAEIGPKGVQALSALEELEFLGLSGSEIELTGNHPLRRLRKLRFLKLNLCELGDEGARAIALLKNLKSLSLGSNGISDDGARALASLTNLTSLDLSSNPKITYESVRALVALTGLTSLDLGFTDIGSQGVRALAALPDLEDLDLSGGRGGIDDDAVGALSSMLRLKRLSFYGGALTSRGIRNIASLPELKCLILNGNNVEREGARTLASLTNLRTLALDNCRIGPEGARALASLTNLRELAVGNNNLGAEAAQVLASLPKLIALELSGNNIGRAGVIHVLNTWLDRPDSGRLRYLNLKDNGDLSSVLPPEVLESTDAQAVLAAYRRYRKAEKVSALQPLNEAKLLVVGNEAVGKTSVIRYLVENKPRNPAEAKTPGAVIHEKIETHAWSPEGSGIRVNIWDFGGQEIMRGTHRFFLTERSLYLLVLEARREDDLTVYDWLKTIRNRGGDSPIIVVINKFEPPHNLRLDEKRLKEDYPNIVKFVRTSCEPGEKGASSIEALRTLIAKTLAKDARLKHVRDPIPTSWLRVKNDLSDKARGSRVLSQRDFERLCEQPQEPASADREGVTDPDEQRALLRLLHDLGVVVAHGLARDAPASLREVTLLDPNWLTSAIYTILNSGKVKDQGGEFSRQQLNELLAPGEYPEERHEFILDMMEHPEVGLCFEVPGAHGERFLIPEALPANEPDYGVWPEDSLRFRYEYDFLPPGLLPRFIVQAHRNLTAKPTKWRTGVVLGAAGCRVLVHADRDKKRIDIAVAGPGSFRRSALNIILNDLEEVHKRNMEIHPKALVPLPSEPQLAVSYEHLLKLEERYGPEHSFDPDGAVRPYTVRELLDGVRRDERLRRGLQPDSKAARVPQSNAPIRDVIALLLTVGLLVIVLGYTWYLTQSTLAFVAVGSVALLVLVSVLAYAAATAKILRGTQLERIFRGVLKKTPVISSLIRVDKEAPRT